MTNQTSVELFAGSIGGITQVLTGQPFDTVKVRLQTQSGIYSSVGDAVSKIWAKEGIHGFYKGSLVPLVGIGACVSIQFAALEAAKRYFKAWNDPLPISQLFLCGAFSGIANSVLSGPIEHIRTRLQIQTDTAQGPSNLIKSIYNNYGIRGIYKGQMITLAREFGGYGIYFATYEALIQRTMGLEGKKRSEIQGWKQCLFGAASGYCLWTVIYPIDVLKSKLQTDNLDPLKRQFSSSIDCFRKTLASDGLAGLYRGFLPCMLRAGPPNETSHLLSNIDESLDLPKPFDEPKVIETLEKHKEIVQKAAENVIDISSTRIVDRVQTDIEKAIEYRNLLKDVEDIKGLNIVNPFKNPIVDKDAVIEQKMIQWMTDLDDGLEKIRLQVDRLKV